MAIKPYLIQTGMGVDLHGQDDTTAAKRAIDNAIHHNSLLFLAHVGITDVQQMKVQVTIATPHPDKLDLDAVKAELRYGDVSVRATSGGMLAETSADGEPLLIANAAVLVSVEGA